jgi:hypothetical protein
MDELFENYFMVLFPILWIAISFVLSRASGWHKLGEKYSRIDFVSGERWRFRSARLRHSVSYNNCVIFISNREGLGISVFFLFRFGHPPLFIPWTDISISNETKFFRKAIRFTVGREFPIPIMVHINLGAKILAAAGRNPPKEAS